MQTRLLSSAASRAAAAFAFTLVALTSATAYAQVFAAICIVPAGRTDLDVALINASTGSRLSLPAGVNTTADEIHPSITPDGKRLVFARVTSGSTRIIVVDLSTGVMSDLFTGVEAAPKPPSGPAITPDGMTVVTGRSDGTSAVTGGEATTLELTLTGLQSFPNGPYTHTVREFPIKGHGTIEVDVDHVAAGGGSKLVAGDLDGNLYLVKKDGTFGTGSVLSGLVNTYYSRPALAANSPQFVFFEEHASGLSSAGDIVFRPATLTDFNGPPTKLPAIVNTTRDESQPAVTADGRYLAFVRASFFAGDFLFVWDTQTQTLLNAQGVALGGNVHSRGGNVSLFSKPLVNTSAISSSGTLSFSLASPSSIGILVQRIVDRTKLLMRPAYELEPVGRVPLGPFPAGRSDVQWDLAVNGEPLEPGRYLVTLRAVEGTIALELGRPHMLVIPE